MTTLPDGWTFTDANAMEWQPRGDKVAMKVLGSADGKLIAMFKFDAGFVGDTHHHEEAEFSYVLDGAVISNGVRMEAGHAYAANAGTTHEEFRTDEGCIVVSVFKSPS